MGTLFHLNAENITRLPAKYVNQNKYNLEYINVHFLI